ncbi:MAG: hypothetical protein K9N47_20970 [Prosthecobacter sp.]|uniref:hypothetical protein n=1 Tax=Prosthecobacter sp. TaxID=1965333 RepID=UPI00260852E2|nr:hypothetical protein [Prosthecobacter sp.]MCF7788608.1 hypothetical protein [Prosthecobacter sp.]
MKFGPCLKLSDLSANLVGPGSWDPDTGIYTCTFGANGTCAGGVGDSEFISTLTLTVSGCGRLRVTGVATGYTFAYGSATLVAYASAQAEPVISLTSPGGGDESATCLTAPMIGTADGTAPFACGDALVITFDRSATTNLGEITATVTVEVDTP